MASLSVSNTFIDGTTIFATPMNTNFDDIETYVNDRNAGSVAWERVLATNASSVPGVFNNGAGTNDILNCNDNGTTVFAVKDAGNSVFGSAAILTTATDGFPYLPSCAGTPSGTPTTFTGRTPLVVVSTNNKLYFYANSAWRNAANNPGVDDSTIELSSNLLRVKDGLTINTLNIGTALQYKTFASSPILQTQQATYTASDGGTQTAFTNTNIVVTITPKLSSSKIFIYTSFHFAVGSGNTASFTIARGGSNLLAAGDGLGRFGANTTNHASYLFIDTPASTSLTTYSIQYKTGAGGVTTQPNAETAVIIAIEVAV